MEKMFLENEKEKRTFTKILFQKILALFFVGHISITTSLIDKCRKFYVALVTMKPNFRPVFFETNNAEANYFLRLKQYET
ncbi:MAG: CRISPR-associated endonuclease Cas1 [Bacteroidales bacterium]